ncbi:hypothetical protein HDV00_003685 [Rhizophlyctis rosea]|nr:hypothetical protein HDV00_003685 [Rhizophlyctis rosea]
METKDNNLTLLVPRLEEAFPFGKDAPTIRRWLLGGKEARKGLQDILQCTLTAAFEKVREIIVPPKAGLMSIYNILTLLPPPSKKLPKLVADKMKSVDNQINYYATLNWDVDRHNKVLTNLRKRVASELSSITEVRELLQVEHIPLDAGEDNPDLLEMLDKFWKTRMFVNDNGSMRVERISPEGAKRLEAAMGRMFEDAEKEMWWVEDMGLETGSWW